MFGEAHENPQAGEKQSFTGEKIYSAGIYARLSVDSRSDKNASIETQIQIGKEYLRRRRDMILYGCYSDLGKTGTSFEREGFVRLMEDVRQGKVNCIIVKDFSRFGRNYLEAGNYIQRLFPALGVRFISVTDGFDSLLADPEDLGINLKNLANEMYARDIGLKVKSSRRARWEEGSYTGGAAPYGYVSSLIGGKKILCPREPGAELVRELYRLWGEGYGLKELVGWLYGRKVHSPAQYRRYGHIYREEKEELLQWSRGSVKLILTNPVYMGCLVKARAGGKAYGLRRELDMVSGDWEIRENTHEALVTRDEFFRAAARFREQERHLVEKTDVSFPKREDIFAGILYCGSCGNRMSRGGCSERSACGRRLGSYGYFCRNSSRIDRFFCERRYTAERALRALAAEILGRELAFSGITCGEITKCAKAVHSREERERSRILSEAERGIARRNRQSSDLYMRYRAGELGWDGFAKRKEENDKGICFLKEREGLFREEALKAEKELWERVFLLHSLIRRERCEGLSGELLRAFIGHIRVFPDKRLAITFRYGRTELTHLFDTGGH